MAVAAQSGAPHPVFTPYDEARPAVQLLAPQLSAEGWPAWVERHDAQIRARLVQGDDDSLVNLVLFGTSFTTQPRLTAKQIETFLASSKDPKVSGARLDAVTARRLDDLVRAASRSDGNERLAFARSRLSANGIDVMTPEGRQRARAFLLHALARVLKEVDTYNRLIAEAERSNVPGAAFAVRSGVYRGRGLSSDTALTPNFAIEEALKSLQGAGRLPASVGRVAIVGAGLDFADKQEGHDFYPQQTVQPFAAADSLIRLGLARRDELLVTAFDISPRVNAHLRHAALKSRGGEPYVLQLPLDMAETWRAPFLAYWNAFGDRIGTPHRALPVPANAGSVKLRAVAVAADVAAKVSPVDLNVIVQRLPLAPADRFDLVLATNVLVYYDEFQRALAMTNIAAMMKPRGILLSNNALVELPSSRLRFIGETTVAYSERKGNGDTIVWYQCID